MTKRQKCLERALSQKSTETYGSSGAEDFGNFPFNLGFAALIVLDFEVVFEKIVGSEWTSSGTASPPSFRDEGLPSQLFGH